MSLLYVGAYFGYMTSSGIAGSLGRTISNFLRNHQIDFQSGCTSLQSHQQWRSVPFSTSFPASAVTWIFYLSHPDWSLTVLYISNFLQLNIFTMSTKHFYVPFIMGWISKWMKSNIKANIMTKSGKEDKIFVCAQWPSRQVDSPEDLSQPMTSLCPRKGVVYVAWVARWPWEGWYM